MPTKQEPRKPELSVAQCLHPHQKKHIQSLGERLEEVVWQYIEQRNNEGQPATFAEIVGTIELVKDRFKP